MNETMKVLKMTMKKKVLRGKGYFFQRSKLEKRMNSDVIWCVAILVVLCLTGATGCRFWLAEFSDLTFVPFIPILQDPNYESMLTFWTFVIILQVMIPLSLYVTLEMAKVGQVYHIGHDIALYDAETGRSAECRALNITEELGQVGIPIDRSSFFFFVFSLPPPPIKLIPMEGCNVFFFFLFLSLSLSTSIGAVYIL